VGDNQRRLKDAKKMMTLLQKQFIVMAVNTFLISASPADTNRAIQKIGHF
jgi:hypothetical protein